MFDTGPMSAAPAPYLSRDDLAGRLPAGSWQRVVYDEFAATISSPVRPFPCVFGVKGFETDQLRYLFIDDEAADPDGSAADRLAAALGRFVAEARSFGPHASLVAFFRPGRVAGIEEYRARMWGLLAALARRDAAPWPAEIPAGTDEPLWEFCFAGEPVFVVCNTPAHIARQSRRSSTFMLTFQPRWVFDKILGTEQAAATSFAKVRRRLVAFDMLPASPDLGRYGAPETREHRQYFLDDANRPAPACPFARLRDTDAEVV